MKRKDSESRRNGREKEKKNKGNHKNDKERP